MPERDVIYKAMARNLLSSKTAAGGKSTTSNSTIRGVQCSFKDYGDPHYDTKKDAVDAALNLLADKGYTLPTAVTFHLSHRNEGFGKQATTAAWTHKEDGSEGPEMMLGLNAMPGKGGGPRGIAHVISENSLGDYTTCVVVHELGHILHAIQSKDYFYDHGDEPPTPHTETAYMKVSPYASSNKKEVVAEVFAAHNMGLKFHGTEVMAMYDAFEGPALQGLLR